MSEKYPLALPEGSVLAGQYIIEKVLGQGGFGITYEAKDHKTGARVAVKEFFPDAMATRTQTTVMPFSGERGESYTYGKECFLQEAETLAQFIGNENIVRIHSYFEENGTAYFVMDFIEGTSFDAYIKQRGGRLSFEETAKILLPVMDALGAVHSRGIIHRDVTPDNIYITSDGTVKLLDFGAARYSLGDKSRSLDVVLKHGFAPKEQYTRRGRQGPFTDVYALGATFYFALTGKRPPDSVERMDEDELISPSTLGVKLPKEAEAAILKALNVQPAERFQNMAAFKNAMLTAAGGQPDTGIAAAPSAVPADNAAPTVSQRFFEAPQASAVAQEVTAAEEKSPSAAPGAPTAQTTVGTTTQTAVGATTASATDQGQQGNGENPADGKKQKNFKKFIPVAAIAAAVLLLIIVVGGNRNSGRSTPPVTDVPAASSPAAASTQESTQTPEIAQTQETPAQEETAAEAPETATTSETTTPATTITPEEFLASLPQESGREMFPEIIGNRVSNLLAYSAFSADGEAYYVTYSDGIKRRKECISELANIEYSVVAGKKEAIERKLGEDTINDVQELESYAGKIDALLVSEECFYIYSIDDKMLYCVDRLSGDLVGQRSFGDIGLFTFAYGLFFYLDKNAETPRICVLPAGDIAGEIYDAFSIELPTSTEDYSSANFYQILFDESDDTLYVGGHDETGKEVLLIKKDDVFESGEFQYKVFDTIPIDENYRLRNAYGDKVYYYHYITDEAGETKEYRITCLNLTEKTYEDIYTCPDDTTGVWGLSVTEDGSWIGVTAYPHVIRFPADGNGEPQIRDYSPNT